MRVMKSSTEMVRQQNSGLVLSALRRFGALSHTDMADHTHLSSATVSAITTELERAGIIERMEQQAATGRGRPRVLFRPSRGCGYLILVRISSDVVQYSLVDYAGTLMDRFDEARGASATNVTVFSRGMLEALDRVIGRSSISRDAVLAISISSKGLVDTTYQRLVWSPVFGDQEIDFQWLLRDWSARIILNNETRLTAQAVARCLEKKQDLKQSLAVLSLGHSIGLGIVQRSSAGALEVTAPNFGHMLHIANGGLCRCGARGCIEASAGFYGILRTAFEVPADTIPAKFVPLAEMDRIATSARQGKRMATYAFRQAGLALGQGISRVLSLHETMPVVLTGPGTRYFDLLQAGMVEGLAQSQPVRREGMPDISLMDDEAGLVFEGHKQRAFDDVDQDILTLRPSASAAMKAG